MQSNMQPKSDCLPLELFHMEMVNYFCDFENEDDNKSREYILYKREKLARLERLGCRVSQSIVERLTKDSVRIHDELDIVKFVCKEFWTSLFQKSIDNLRTNHQGIYVLHDNDFRYLKMMSDSTQYSSIIDQYLAFPCGLLKGALLSFGIECQVTAKCINIPACSFDIRISK